MFDRRDDGWRPAWMPSDWSRLRFERFWAGLSQEELAEAVGVSRQTISSLECGRSLPSLVLARAIARRLGMTVDELFADDELH